MIATSSSIIEIKLVFLNTPLFDFDVKEAFVNLKIKLYFRDLILILAFSC